MAWWKIKAYKNNLAKKRREDAGRPTEETEHPTMETHPGARVPDPVTGEKPKPVRKPRVKKPKPPVDETPEVPSVPVPPVDPSTSDVTGVEPATTTDKPLTWGSDQ